MEHRIQRDEYSPDPQDLQSDNESDPGVDYAAVPNVNANGNVTRQLAERLQPQRQRPCVSPAPEVEAQQPRSMEWLTDPAANKAPLSEWDRSQAIMSLAFPSLFPTGEGDFVQPREREISFNDYVVHLMRYSDGRFA